MLTNCFRFAPRDSVPGLIAKICKYLKDHPGWSEEELKEQIKHFIEQTGVESFNGRTGAVVLNEDDVNNLKIESAYFAEGDETIDELDLVALYNQGVRFVFTNWNSVTSGYDLSFVLDYFGDSNDVVYYPMATGSVGGNIVSVNGKTGIVELSLSDILGDSGAQVKLCTATEFTSNTIATWNAYYEDGYRIVGVVNYDASAIDYIYLLRQDENNHQPIGISYDASDAYTPTNPPPYPVTSVNGDTGEVFTLRVDPSDPGVPTDTPAPINATTLNGKDAGYYATAESVNQLSKKKADNSAVFELTSIPQFTNVFDTVEIEYGKILSVSSGIVSDTTARLATTGMIPVKAGDIIRMSDFALTESGSPCVVFYNSAGEYIIGLRGNALPESGGYYANSLDELANGSVVALEIVRPSAGGFIRISTSTDEIGVNPVLTINEEIVYEDGYGTKLNPKVKVDYAQITNAPSHNGWSILPNEHLAICYSGINRKPINTVEHFVDAAENFGFNALKCDVRPTADGELVCCHDAGFTFDGNGYITAYDSANQTLIHDVTAATCLAYSFGTGEHPCLVGDYLDVCRKYKKIAFITIRNEYMDVVIPKLLEELRKHNMTYSTIINSMTYESLVQWRKQDNAVMINYTLNFGVAIDQAQIDRAIGLGYCSISGFSLSSASTDPSAACDFEYARANGIRVLEAIAYKEGSPEACYALGYDGCTIGYPWGNPAGGVSADDVKTMIDDAIGATIGGAY